MAFAEARAFDVRWHDAARRAASAVTDGGRIAFVVRGGGSFYLGVVLGGTREVLMWSESFRAEGDAWRLHDAIVGAASRFDRAGWDGGVCFLRRGCVS
jgi:hypothetical protein